MNGSDRPDKNRILVAFSSLMLVMLLASLDQTVVVTALPTIAGDFDALAHLSWIVTAYMVAAAVVTPIYGKLGDLFGRKVVLQVAIAIFLIGSMLCGLSRTMTQLVAFRGLQGLGGGGLMISASVSIADLVSPRERARYQGIAGAVFGVATVIGPLTGGFFVEHFSWRWIFFINLPLGLIAMAVLAFAFPPRSVARRAPSIDALGAILIAIALTAIALLLSLGGTGPGWTSRPFVGLLLLALVSIGAFIFWERRAADPIVPLTMFRNRTFVLSCAIGFAVSMSLFGSVTFMPLYLQVVKGVSPSLSGLALTPLMVGVVSTSVLSGQLIGRNGKATIFPRAGTAIMTVGLCLLATLGVESSVWRSGIYMLILGLGIGMVSQVLVLIVQCAMPFRDVGAATSTLTMSRSTGASIGVAIFGAVFAAGMASDLAARLPGVAPTLAGASIAAWPSGQQLLYLDIFSDGLHRIFLLAAVLTAIAFVLTWALRQAPLGEEQEPVPPDGLL